MLAFLGNFLEERTIIAPFQETVIHQERFAFHVFPGGHQWIYQGALKVCPILSFLCFFASICDFF